MISRRPSAHPAVALALTAALALGACTSDDGDVASTGSTAGDDASTTTAGSAGELEGTDWLLVSDGTSVTVPAGVPVTLTVEGAVASGTGPCNAYSAPMTVDGDTIEIGAVASSMMTCEEPLMAAEAEYFSALAGVQSFEVTEEQLVLSGADDVTLTYEVVPTGDETALAGEWEVVNLATSGALAGLSTPIEGTTPTVTFTDGTVALGGGCNNGSSTYVLDGDSLTFTPVAATMMACEEPAGIMDQDADLAAALERTSRVELAPSQAILLDADGVIVLVLRTDAA